MARLPDLEGLAIFAKVADCRSFSNAAEELHLSKATVSKAIIRLESKLGVLLIIRSARRFELTEEGRSLFERAARILAEGESAEDATRAEARAPRGLVRLAVPTSFGTMHVAPLLPEFLAGYPEVTLDLHFHDGVNDVIREGFDAAIRIAVQPGPSLDVQLLREMPRYLVGSTTYLSQYGRPTHPMHLAAHSCISYSNSSAADLWRFSKGRKTASVRPAGPLSLNNGDAMMPALVAGVGLGVLPEFFLRDALESGELERLLPDWSLPLGGVYWVMPPEGPVPKRVEVLRDFLVERLSEG